MSRRKQRDRLYYRDERGWYADFRDYRDTGGGREAMVPDGERNATQDRDVANALAAARLEELKELRKSGGGSEAEPGDVLLVEYAMRHLTLKEAEGDRPATVDRNERAVRTVLKRWGTDTRLSDVTPNRVADYIAYRGRQVANQTLLHEIHAMSNLFRRAVTEGRALFNPFDRDHLFKKPEVRRKEAVWLEIGEARRLIECAAAEDADPHPRAFPHLGPIVATTLLTGARWGEVSGLEVADVDLEAGHVRIHPNRWRKLKSRHATRRVPLWPQLDAILRAYLAKRPDLEGLLFPAEGGGRLADLRTGLRNAVEAAKIEKHVTWHTLRHTYAAARLQTTDAGAPVSPYTVMKELGHGSLKLIEETYGHLMETRHRRPVVEFHEAEVVSIERAR
jgi:integrase